MTKTQSPLQVALSRRECDYTAIIDRLRGLDEVEGTDVEALRECAFLTRCLGRLLKGRTVAEVHDAFGSPGDFGYEKPIGKALLATYEGT